MTYDKVDPLQSICDAATENAGVRLRMLRLDLLHPLLQGNKWFKLRLNLEAARRQGHGTLLSFGGAYSNHIHALAAAGPLHGFRTIGIIRGELAQPLNPVLAFAREQGMELHAVSRAEYRDRHTPAFEARLRERFDDFYLIPEGGANLEGVLGCRQIAEHFSWSVPAAKRHVLLACGTGTTMAGILAGACSGPQDCLVTGIAVLKGGGFLEREVRRWLQQAGAPDPGNWRIETEWHCGGYAKTTPELLRFIDDFADTHDIPLEPVYTGKMMQALYGKMRAGGFPPGSEIIAIHTGGLHSR